MVRPIDFQDNFSKAVLAQKFADQLHAGKEKELTLNQYLIRKELERRQNPLRTLDEYQGSKEISPDEKRERGRGGKRRADEEGEEDKTGEGGDSEGMEGEQDLRLRREEDDAGKGDKLDIRG